MDIWFAIMELVMLLGGAFFMGALAQRLGQSPILGYLLAGTIVGPLLFNTVAVNQTRNLREIIFSTNVSSFAFAISFAISITLHLLRRL